uniref:Uncharacterized protein n=1 Tax=Sphaerodactylus townsendi TaxID=933632 RepID=A0ACB8EVB5_9SAUR
MGVAEGSCICWGSACGAHLAKTFTFKAAPRGCDKSRVANSGTEYRPYTELTPLQVTRHYGVHPTPPPRFGFSLHKAAVLDLGLDKEDGAPKKVGWLLREE